MGIKVILNTFGLKGIFYIISEKILRHFNQAKRLGGWDLYRNALTVLVFEPEIVVDTVLSIYITLMRTKFGSSAELKFNNFI